MSCKVVEDNNRRRLSVISQKISTTILIFGLHAREHEVKRQTLKQLLCGESSVFSWCGLHLFRFNASWAGGQDRYFVLEFRDTMNKLVSLVEILVVRMVKALVPEHSFRSHSD